jgi:hypothetical protein
VRNKLLLLLFTGWILLAVFDVFYNSVKSVSEFKTWFFLSDVQKKQMIFGDLYDFLIFIGDYTQKSDHILIYSKDVRTFFYGAYTLYPRIISVADNNPDFTKLIGKTKFDYVVLYDDKQNFNGYQLIASYSSKISKDFGGIYKRND